jgi:gliding motility-associated-like protein
LFRATIKGAKEAEGFIYDRWGLLLFTYDALNASWDGKVSGGTNVPDATYFYLIKVTDKLDAKTDYKGHFLIAR